MVAKDIAAAATGKLVPNQIATRSTFFSVMKRSEVAIQRGN
ncbi:hypothetical protein [Paraburkholderia sp. J94]|nr:hypothetical protein [Paraburkholderia sp. J94]